MEKGIIRLINQMISDPDRMDQMIEDQKKRLEWRRKSYDQKLKRYEDDPEWVVEFRVKGDRRSGWTAYPVNSKEGKEIRSRMRREKKEEERKVFESENPMDAALDHVLELGVDSTVIAGLTIS